MINRSSLLVWVLVWVQVCTDPALGCEWDRASYPDKGLTLMALQPLEERCLKTCCDLPDCDMVVMSHPVNGSPECHKVNCAKDPDLCGLKPSALLRIYRKKAKKQVDGPERSNQANDVRCRLPMKVGLCRAAFPRFYYNSTSQSCRSFIYGGCNANGNNFKTLQECEVTCSGISGPVLPDEPTPVSPAAASGRVLVLDSKMSAADFTEHCGAEPQVGPCRAAFQHWYYNSKTGDCHQFIYGGCKGNKNNYITKESCIATCTAALPSSQKADEVSAEYKDSCMVTSDPGPCRAAFPMFYYNPNTATCQSFIYGGCHGNKNRYSTMEECMSRCSQDGSFNTHGKTRDRWTPAVFLFITLAAISALLLVTLFIITLRRHILTHRSSSFSDKEELLPDPDEQSSQESLTVPESPRPDQA